MEKTTAGTAHTFYYIAMNRTAMLVNLAVDVNTGRLLHTPRCGTAEE